MKKQATKTAAKAAKQSGKQGTKQASGQGAKQAAKQGTKQSAKQATKQAAKQGGKQAAAKQAAKGAANRSANTTDELTKLLKEQMKDVLSAEKQLLRALPKMAKAATSPEIKHAFTNHLEETRNQVTRLEEAFALMGAKPTSKHCEAMEGLVKEGEEAIEETDGGTLLRDVVLIIAAQKVEHYEIAAYGSLRSLATVLGLGNVAKLMQQTLDEEGNADKLLTTLSDAINPEAQQEA